MKTSMKLLTACIAALCLLGLNSCGITIIDPPERNCNTIYKYINQSSTAINITKPNINSTTGQKDIIFSIPLGGYKEVPYGASNYKEPLFVGYARIEISNGTVIVSQRNISESLFDYRSYDYKSIDCVSQYEYTFTDDFFKDGTPIEK